jgi:hypothetical protein
MLTRVKLLAGEAARRLCVRRHQAHDSELFVFISEVFGETHHHNVNFGAALHVRKIHTETLNRMGVRHKIKKAIFEFFRLRAWNYLIEETTPNHVVNRITYLLSNRRDVVNDCARGVNLI